MSPDRSGKIGVLLFYCRRTPANEYAGLVEMVVWDEKYREIELPCAGRVGTGELMQGLAAGYDKVVVLSCGDNSCVHQFGCTEAKKAMETVRRLAETAGLDPDRLVFIEVDNLPEGITFHE